MMPRPAKFQAQSCCLLHRTISSVTSTHIFSIHILSVPDSSSLSLSLSLSVFFWVTGGNSAASMQCDVVGWWYYIFSIQREQSSHHAWTDTSRWPVGRGISLPLIRSRSSSITLPGGGCGCFCLSASCLLAWDFKRPGSAMVSLEQSRAERCGFLSDRVAVADGLSISKHRKGHAL
jgi:hypothetical protein